LRRNILRPSQPTESFVLARSASMRDRIFMLPIARWKGYGSDTDFHGAALETITWAVGLLCASKRMTVFGTVHATGLRRATTGSLSTASHSSSLHRYARG
jgi:hypothetical protein